MKDIIIQTEDKHEGKIQVEDRHEGHIQREDRHEGKIKSEDRLKTNRRKRQKRTETENRLRRKTKHYIKNTQTKEYIRRHVHRTHKKDTRTHTHTEDAQKGHTNHRHVQKWTQEQTLINKQKHTHKTLLLFLNTENRHIQRTDTKSRQTKESGDGDKGQIVSKNRNRTQKDTEWSMSEKQQERQQ